VEAGARPQNDDKTPFGLVVGRMIDNTDNTESTPTATLVPDIAYCLRYLDTAKRKIEEAVTAMP
jgi:hypothetical protein